MFASRNTSLFAACLLKALRPSIALRMSATLVEEGTSETITSLKRAHEEATPEVEEKKPRPEFQRIKKRKYAVLICYSGQGYLGLQRNPGMKTIEEDLLKAWHKVGVVTDEGYANPKVIEFQRAARTDKGVSAVRQILSAKLPLEVDLDAVNKHLPDQIRMVSLKRATKGKYSIKGFNCKGNADARTYSYMFPSFALAPKDEPISDEYRITADVLKRTNEVLSVYLGTHNYHNFTSKKSFLDPSANRYIIKMFCEEPVMCEGMEFVTIYVKGQSFMLHQIRKMVGLAIAIVRGFCTECVITKAWAEEKLDIPIAPGLGLVLEEVHYDRYNQRFGGDGVHEAIEWSNVKPELDEFKHNFILTEIVRTEKEENSMTSWLETLIMHTFDIRRDHLRLPPTVDIAADAKLDEEDACEALSTEGVVENHETNITNGTALSKEDSVSSDEQCQSAKS